MKNQHRLASYLSSGWLKFFILTIVLTTLPGCKSVVADTGLLFVSLTDKKFKATTESSIEIFTDRKKIQQKYYEIGILKSNVKQTPQKIKSVAASYGAEAVILEGLNHTLIRYSLDDEKEDSKWKSI